MFESLLKLHPGDPSLVRPNGRRATRLAVRVPRRALRKPPRCTGRTNCQAPPPWVNSGSCLPDPCAYLPCL